ncbi:hypothetical protein EU528_14465 [Candidatus Thorarchaeota archaeon]|nr:MAG: hypothetical protein EU528_14465 [Candidatus Thorarchaeota archaeon]
MEKKFGLETPTDIWNWYHNITNEPTKLGTKAYLVAGLFSAGTAQTMEFVKKSKELQEFLKWPAKARIVSEIRLALTYLWRSIILDVIAYLIRRWRLYNPLTGEVRFYSNDRILAKNLEEYFEYMWQLAGFGFYKPAEELKWFFPMESPHKGFYVHLNNIRDGTLLPRKSVHSVIVSAPLSLTELWHKPGIIGSGGYHIERPLAGWVNDIMKRQYPDDVREWIKGSDITRWRKKNTWKAMRLSTGPEMLKHFLENHQLGTHIRDMILYDTIKPGEGYIRQDVVDMLDFRFYPEKEGTKIIICEDIDCDKRIDLKPLYLDLKEDWDESVDEEKSVLQEEEVIENVEPSYSAKCPLCNHSNLYSKSNLLPNGKLRCKRCTSLFNPDSD